MVLDSPVMFYLDEMYADGVPDFSELYRRVRIHFDIPPFRAAELVNRWAKIHVV